MTVGMKKITQRVTVKKFPRKPQTPNRRKRNPARIIEKKRSIAKFHGNSKKKKYGH